VHRLLKPYFSPSVLKPSTSTYTPFSPAKTSRFCSLAYSSSAVSVFCSEEPAIAPDSLIEVYRDSEVKHADETGWRTDGNNGYAWLFCTPKISIFRFRRTRSASVPREIFGEKPVPGVLVVDRYNGYNKMLWKHRGQTLSYNITLGIMSDLCYGLPHGLSVSCLCNMPVCRQHPTRGELKKLHEQTTKDKDLRKIVAKLEKRLASLMS